MGARPGRPGGPAAAHPLGPGESGAAFLPDGSLLFTSTRDDPEAAADAKPDGEVARLWLLPAGGGEARPVASAPAGIDLHGWPATPARSCTAPASTPGPTTWTPTSAATRPAATPGSAPCCSRPTRSATGTTTWGRGAAAVRGRPAPGRRRPHGPGRALTPAPGRALDEQDVAVTPDGATVVCGWDTGEVTNPRSRLVAIDVASGERRVLLDDPAASVGQIACSPDGRLVVCERIGHGDPGHPRRRPVAGRPGRRRGPRPDRRPRPVAGEPVWAADGRAVFFVADEGGRTPVFRVEVGGGDEGRVTRLSADGAFSDLARPRRAAAVRPAGDHGRPGRAVALDPAAADQRPAPLPSPGLPLAVPGALTEVETRAGDGTPLRGWLVLPTGASGARPAPLVFIHGGPLSSWSAWSWRWNPWLLAARGYRAPARPGPVDRLRAGVRGPRAGRWGAEPYTDLMALVDAAEARPDVDERRTAAMGGSFGGYMANWVAGQTDRFRCIVTHASVWSLEQFHGPPTTPPGGSGSSARPRRCPSATGTAPPTAPGPDPHAHAGHPRRARPPGADRRGPALWTDLTRSGWRPVPLLPRREPLDPHPAPRPRLVRDGARLPRPARPRQGLGPPGAALAPRGGRVLDPSNQAHAKAAERLRAEPVSG